MRRPPNYNLVVDLLKVETFKTFLKQATFLSKAVKYQGLLSKIFSVICKQSLVLALIIVLFSPSRWSSVKNMFQCLRTAMRPMSEMPLAV